MTEASEFVLPGHYKLLSAVIRTHASNRPINISGLIPSIIIEESLDYDCIRGVITLHDSIGFLEDLPVRGEETLIIELEDALREKRTYELFVYKAVNINIKDTNDGLTYDLHFISKGRYETSKRKIVRAFDNPISTIAEIIFSTYYPEGKDCFIEDTSGTFRCTIPTFTPAQTMNFLTSRAYSDDSPSCSFRFFETYDNFFFVSDEYLINRAKDDPDSIKEFTYNEALDNSGAEFIAQMKNLKKIENSERVNTMQDLNVGSYRSNVIELDIMRRMVTNRRYNYLDVKDQYAASPVGSTEGIHSESFVNDFFTEENENRYLVVKDYASIGDIPGAIRGEQYLPEITTNRIAYRQRLNNTIVYANAHGRFDLSAGDIIKLLIPDFSVANGQQRENNKQLSGHYLVNSCTHRFIRDTHDIQLKLVKYDWGS
jgi:hypothetical protein